MRLSRDRFWGAALTPDKQAAYRTLYESFSRVTVLLAPFVPFLAESLYQQLIRPVDRPSDQKACT